MRIVFEFQGEEQYAFDIGSKVKKIVFNFAESDSEPYNQITLKIPTIKEIEFYEE